MVGGLLHRSRTGRLLDLLRHALYGDASLADLPYLSEVADRVAHLPERTAAAERGPARRLDAEQSAGRCARTRCCLLRRHEPERRRLRLRTALTSVLRRPRRSRPTAWACRAWSSTDTRASCASRMKVDVPVSGAGAAARETLVEHRQPALTSVAGRDQADASQWNWASARSSKTSRLQPRRTRRRFMVTGRGRRGAGRDCCRVEAELARPLIWRPGRRIFVHREPFFAIEPGARRPTTLMVADLDA